MRRLREWAGLELEVILLMLLGLLVSPHLAWKETEAQGTAPIYMAS
jgi:hypothetical protein